MSPIIDKLTGLLEGGFLLGYVAPSIVGVACLVLVFGVEAGLGNACLEWTRLSATQQAWMIATAAVCIGATALVLQVFTGPLIRLYEGYPWPRFLAEWGRGRQKSLLKRYPEQRPASDLMPTAFGNALRAAEEHAFNLFGMDGVRWWPRLLQVVPAELQGQVWSSLVPVIALLNLSTIFCVGVVVAGGVLLSWGHTWWLFPAVIMAGTGAARLCYRTAVAQAAGYGGLVRAAFELYRHRILTEMGIDIPESFVDEQYLWKALTDWVAPGNPPPFAFAEAVPDAPDWMRAPFYYRRQSPAEKEKALIVGPLRMTLRIRRDRR
jgi:hypothetical protein